MNYFLLVIFAIILSSCQDDYQAEPSSGQNTFSGKKNKQTWSGITEIRLDKETDTLTFSGISNQPNDEVIVMKIKFQGLGQYPLIKNQAYYYSTTGGDVLTSEYKIVPNSTGQLVISGYDKEKKTVEGNFNVDLKNIWSFSGNEKDTLKLSDGNFKGTIAE